MGVQEAVWWLVGEVGVGWKGCGRGEVQEFAMVVWFLMLFGGDWCGEREVSGSVLSGIFQCSGTIIDESQLQPTDEAKPKRKRRSIEHISRATRRIAPDVQRRLRSQSARHHGFEFRDASTLALPRQMGTHTNGSKTCDYE